MRDIDVRAVLLSVLGDEFGDDPDARIVEELGVLQGSARIDVAVINGRLCGYEIKSASDTLQRLESQRAAYSLVFDRITAVVAGSHLAPVEAELPQWWGITVAAEASGGVMLEPVRAALDNPAADPSAVVQLLWRDEALEILEGLGNDRGVRGARRQLLWDRLVETVPADRLGELVRSRLRERRQWRDGR